MKTKFPLCRQLGLLISHYSSLGGDVIDASQLESILAAAPVVHSNPEGSPAYDDDEMSDSKAWGKLTNYETHQGRVILIEPIVKDTAESILKDLVAYFENGLAPSPKEFSRYEQTIKRAQNFIKELK